MKKIAILSAYTADTSFNMFAAEVQYHADYLEGLFSGLGIVMLFMPICRLIKILQTI